MVGVGGVVLGLGLVLLLQCGGSGGVELNMFFLADPQYSFKGKAGSERALEVTEDVVELTRLCTDCPKVVPIAGDLVHNDGEDKKELYTKGYKRGFSRGVKILDGVGNHDTTAMLPLGSSFQTERDLLSRLEDVLPHPTLSGLERSGWEVVHYAKSKVDNGEGGEDGCRTFAKDPKYFCHHEVYYYTVGIGVPGSGEVSGYVVQLHNGMYTESAVRYLEAAKDAVLGGNPGKPVVVVAHQFTGSRKSAMTTLLRGLNVVAVIHGHYHCNQDGLGMSHCDETQTSPGYTVDAFGPEFKNVHGAPIVRINANAAFWNIFWGMTIDTEAEVVRIQRFDRSEIGSVSKYPASRFRELVERMGSEGSSKAYSMPYRSKTPYTCSYGRGAGGKECIEQIREGGLLIPSGSYQHQYPSDGHWGTWGRLAICPEGKFVYGYRLRSEENHLTDDTGLNDVQLFCYEPGFGASQWSVLNPIQSAGGKWGSWGSLVWCPGWGANPVTGFKVRVEKEQGSLKDDSGANDVDLKCSDGTWISAPVKHSVGSWTDDVSCKEGYAVAGLITRVEVDQGDFKDDTALNGVRLLCKKYPFQ